MDTQQTGKKRNKHVWGKWETCKSTQSRFARSKKTGEAPTGKRLESGMSIAHKAHGARQGWGMPASTFIHVFRGKDPFRIRFRICHITIREVLA